MKQYIRITDERVSQRETEHMSLVRKLAGECIVLLENDGTLPLQKGGSLALYGSGARQTIRGGTGSGDVNARVSVSVEQGLKNAGFCITTGDWLDRQDAGYEQARRDYFDWAPRYAREQGISEFLAYFSHPFQVIPPVPVTEKDITASETDTAVLVISRTSGEGADRRNRRGDYLLYEEEKALLKQLGSAYARLILVLNTGGVMDMSEVKDIPGINAVLLMGQLGSAGGDALADVITGETAPSGRLTDTWAQHYDDYPSSAGFSLNDGNVDDEYYTEGIYVGYRYFDSFDVEPLYPFGYGMSYTDFAVSCGSAEVDGDTVCISASVKNTGAVCSGREVVQVYCTPPAGKLPKPMQVLVGFAKTGLLAPGEEETVRIRFPADEMASYSEECAAWVLEAGEYVLRIGKNSRDTQPAAVLTLDETVPVKKLRNLFRDSDPVQEIVPPGLAPVPADASVPRMALDRSAVSTVTAEYTGERKPFPEGAGDRTLTVEDIKNGSCSMEELVSQLTIEEMAELCVGTMRGSGGAVVGGVPCEVPGAAGDTSAVIKAARGAGNIIMADGPAGLRLQPVFKTAPDGTILPGGEILGDMYQPFDSESAVENAVTCYQYCTAIPVGWSLAQSWNMPLLEQTGAMIGREMEQFGVDLWLAPALNIHRNPLCGRNFEYFSEDPLISGMAAAAITNGVQSIPGKGTTIKHLAVNNQEENRYFTNSHVSERALREIYLRGFEIAVTRSQPLAIMTSYNLLNGIHTANHRDLLQSAVRDEWGYEGVIMTDWFTSQDQPDLTGSRTVIYPISSSVGCIYAGNDLQMPGCQKNVDDIEEAVRTGRETDGFCITLADLQYCASNIIRAVICTSR